VAAGSLGTRAEQHALADAVSGYADHARLVGDARRLAESGEDRLPECWSGLAAQELLALPFDGTLLDVCVAIEELGHALAPGPVVSTMLGGVLVRHHGDDALRATVEQGLRDGTVSFAVAIDDVLLGGSAVSHVLLPVDGQWQVVETRSVEVASYGAVDGTRPFGRITSPPAAAGSALPTLTDTIVRETAVTLLAAESAGIASWCVDTATEYAKVREQFGRPIGAFQAVKHRCADMLAQLELARASAWDAAAAVDHEPDDDIDPEARALAVAVAAATAPAAAVECAKSCIQVLGGIGFTWEHDAHLYLKRALADRQVLGGAERWQQSAGRLASAGARRVRTLELGVDAEQPRTEVREFLQTLDGLDDRKRRVAIADSGYLVPHWPAPYGRDAGPMEQLVIDEEFRRAGVARPDLIIGNWALPTILQYGTDEQRARFGPPTLHGDITWCQMFSEPGAGSDLASLQTKATRVEGGWSLSGQKVWTSGARKADWAICLARTSVEANRHSVSGRAKHDGITYFLVDMKTAGLDVRPLRELTGEALFNEIFLNDVFVPDDCVVGEVGGGWRLARTTLANERVAMSSGSAFPSGVEDLLDALARSTDPKDEVALTRVGRLVCLAQADAMLGVRATLARVSGTDPGATSSVRKLVGMHLRQDSAELALDLLGQTALTAGEEEQRVIRRFLANRSLTIAGGTSEVLHNVIGERILGLPRD
jgi:alkylation response protein AidB-like acyl-CoA dehydrogenase